MRSGSSLFGNPGFRRLVLDLYPLPRWEAVRTIVTRLQDFADGELRDDVAVLALKVL